MAFESPEEFARVKDIIAASNEENFDRLETLLRDADPFRNQVVRPARCLCVSASV